MQDSDRLTSWQIGETSNIDGGGAIGVVGVVMEGLWAYGLSTVKRMGERCSFTQPNTLMA